MDSNRTCLISTQAAAILLGLSPRTLEALRFKREGPPYVKFGRAVRYNVDELRQWIERHRIDHGEATNEGA